MDILIQIIGYSFIPLLLLLLASGIASIYNGLKDHFQFQGFKISEFPFNQKANDLVTNLNLRRLNIDFCES